jgi:hypothetical protein
MHGPTRSFWANLTSFSLGQNPHHKGNKGVKKVTGVAGIQPGVWLYCPRSPGVVKRP